MTTFSATMASFQSRTPVLPMESSERTLSIMFQGYKLRRHKQFKWGLKKPRLSISSTALSMSSYTSTTKLIPPGHPAREASSSARGNNQRILVCSLTDDKSQRLNHCKSPVLTSNSSGICQDESNYVWWLSESG